MLPYLFHIKFFLFSHEHPLLSEDTYQTLRHISEYEAEFQEFLETQQDHLHFKQELNYILLRNIPETATTSLCTKYLKFGPIMHILLFPRQNMDTSQSQSYAYLGYCDETSIVRAFRQGKFCLGTYTDPHIAQWTHMRPHTP